MQVSPHIFHFVMDLSKLEPVITIFNGNKVIDNICIIHKFKSWYAHCMLPFSWSWEKNISQQFDLVKCKGIANSRYYFWKKDKRLNIQKTLMAHKIIYNIYLFGVLLNGLFVSTIISKGRKNDILESKMIMFYKSRINDINISM